MNDECRHGIARFEAHLSHCVGSSGRVPSVVSHEPSLHFRTREAAYGRDNVSKHVAVFVLIDLEAEPIAQARALRRGGRYLLWHIEAHLAIEAIDVAPRQQIPPGRTPHAELRATCVATACRHRPRIAPLALRVVVSDTALVATPIHDCGKATRVLAIFSERQASVLEDIDYVALLLRGPAIPTLQGKIVGGPKPDRQPRT